jgi:hypothetical protein
MKNLILLSLLASNLSFAATSNINGDSALKLRKALIDAGATAKIMTDASFVSVSSIECKQEGGFVLLPPKCEFVEEGRLVTVDQGTKSAKLVKALNDAGIKTVNTRIAELSVSKTSAKSISCSTMAIHRMVGCEIKK